MIESNEFPDLKDLPDEHPLTIDMDEYPYIVEEILDKRIEQNTSKITDYLVKWFGYAQLVSSNCSEWQNRLTIELTINYLLTNPPFFRDEATWEPESNLPSIVVQEYEQDMEELEALAGINSKKPPRRPEHERKNSQTSSNSGSAQSLVTSSWQTRRKQRLEQLLSRKLKTIKSIRLRDGTLEFLCLW